MVLEEAAEEIKVANREFISQLFQQVSEDNWVLRCARLHKIIRALNFVMANVSSFAGAYAPDLHAEVRRRYALKHPYSSKMKQPCHESLSGEVEGDEVFRNYVMCAAESIAEREDAENLVHYFFVELVLREIVGYEEGSTAIGYWRYLISQRRLRSRREMAAATSIVHYLSVTSVTLKLFDPLSRKLGGKQAHDLERDI